MLLFRILSQYLLCFHRIGISMVNCSGLLIVQVETGVPFMLYKDACNRKSNQRNLGTIRCSNLCTEIVEYTSPEETAVCNLASIALPRFVRDKSGSSRERVRVVGSLDSANRSALQCASI